MKRGWSLLTKDDSDAFCDFHTYDLIFKNFINDIYV